MAENCRCHDIVFKICKFAKRVFGSLETATVGMGIIFGMMGLVLCGSQIPERTVPMIAAKMMNLMLLSNIALIFGVLTERADFLWGHISANLVVCSGLPVLIIISVTTWRIDPVYPITAVVFLMTLPLQMIVVYGLLREMKYGPDPDEFSTKSPAERENNQEKTLYPDAFLAGNRNHSNNTETLNIPAA